MWLFTAHAAFYMQRDGDGYTIWHGYVYVGMVYCVACDLEYRDDLWGSAFKRTPRLAAKALIGSHTEAQWLDTQRDHTARQPACSLATGMVSTGHDDGGFQ